MSCHDIGRGMNSVVKEIITLLDNNELSKEAAKKLIKSCLRGVYWCDGNEGEAVNYISHYLCGMCLKKVPKGENLYELPYDVWNKIHEDVFHGAVCKDCLEKLGIKEKYAIESTGEYAETNNGISWPSD